MEAVSTRLRLRVSPGARSAQVVAGLDSTQIERRLSSAAGKERNS
jgi:hypothetical protein